MPRAGWVAGPLAVSDALVDGTTITAPGADRPTWRLILDFDPEARRLCGLSLSPAKQGESLDRCCLDPGDLAIADRGFARPAGLAAIREQGADFLVRLGQRSLRLFDADNTLIALDQVVLGIDQPVFIGRTGAPSLHARLITVPLPQQAAERNRRKLQRAGQQEGYTPSEAAGVTAGHMILLTSLSEKLASAWLHANLIGTLLTENLAAAVLDSPPSGPGRQTQTSLNLAPYR